MVPLEAEIDAERESRAPKTEAGKDLTEEQKSELFTLQQELGKKKTKKFEELLKAYSPTVFNTNVLKEVKLAMTPEELAGEEAKVKELSKFIYDHAIQNLIKTLSKNENIQTDSQSLRDTFHQNGLNIRYLGRIAEEIKDKNLTHLKFLLEREVIMRTMKHLLNKYLRECPSAD